MPEEGVLSIFNSIYLGLLKVVDIFEYAFNIFSGVKNITVNNNGVENENYFLNFLFTNSGISKVFWGLTGIAFVIAVVLAITAFIRANMDTENKRTIGRVIGLVIKTAITFLIIPSITLVILWITNVAINKIDNIFLVYRNPLSYTVDLLINELSSSIGSSEMINIIGIIVVAVLIILMAMASFVVLLRIFEMLLLYLVSPFFAVSMPIDDGKRFKELVRMFMIRVCSCLGIIIAMKLYLFVIPVIIKDGLYFSSVVYVDIALKLIFICGGMFAVYKSNKLIIQLFGEKKEEEKEESKEVELEPEIKLLGDGKKKEVTSNLFSGYNNNLYR